MMHNGLIAPHLQAFFAEYLAQQKRLSPQTIVSCRDTFRLWLTFLRTHGGIEPSAVRLTDVDAPAVLRFLDYLEQQRGNSVRSRNKWGTRIRNHHLEARADLLRCQHLRAADWQGPEGADHPPVAYHRAGVAGLVP